MALHEPTVFITRHIPEEALRIIRSAADVRVWPEELPPSPEELRRECEGVDGLYCMLTDRIDGALLDATPRLKVISTMSVGYDHIDVSACRERGILLGHTPGVLDETTADLAFALILASGRRIAEADRFVRAGKWETWSPMFMTGQEVHGATLGIVGIGRIGQAVARRARGFGMRLLYHSRSPKPESEGLGAEYRSMDDLLRESDFVSLHVPLTEETRGLIGARELAVMKPTAHLINTARGPVVDQRALSDALARGQIAGAGIDVFEMEPVSIEEPLLALENVTVLPHIGSATVATRTKMARMAADNLVAGLQGKPMPHPI
ncbi:MAG: D-glycerate dehydrogenase [Armatimonadetes bacterium]|nr:D-glycerate dehydrogenase [Armatimonadota bacterium]